MTSQNQIPDDLEKKRQETKEKLLSELKKNIEAAFVSTLDKDHTLSEKEKDLIKNTPSMQETNPDLYKICELSFQTLFKEHIKKTREYIKKNVGNEGNEDVHNGVVRGILIGLATNTIYDLGKNVLPEITPQVDIGFPQY